MANLELTKKNNLLKKNIRRNLLFKDENQLIDYINANYNHEKKLFLFKLQNKENEVEKLNKQLSEEINKNKEKTIKNIKINLNEEISSNKNNNKEMIKSIERLKNNNITFKNNLDFKSLENDKLIKENQIFKKEFEKTKNGKKKLLLNNIKNELKNRCDEYVEEKEILNKEKNLFIKDSKNNIIKEKEKLRIKSNDKELNQIQKEMKRIIFLKKIFL